MKRRDFLIKVAGTAGAMLIPVSALASLEGLIEVKPEVKEDRYVRVRTLDYTSTDDDGTVYHKVVNEDKPFKELKKGDIFRIYEANDTIVQDDDGNKTFEAIGEPYIYKYKGGYTWAVENKVWKHTV